MSHVCSMLVDIIKHGCMCAFIGVVQIHNNNTCLQLYSEKHGDYGEKTCF